jgi:hypothetical protein
MVIGVVLQEDGPVTGNALIFAIFANINALQNNSYFT